MFGATEATFKFVVGSFGVHRSKGPISGLGGLMNCLMDLSDDKVSPYT